ncbi:MAG: phosphatase PAP2 family protein, partial [Alphaproteobacteria bacterium]|nr:phosphatase PAP2 family protein [Alphaproteobacteria bacterium]
MNNNRMKTEHYKIALLTAAFIITEALLIGYVDVPLSQYMRTNIGANQTMMDFYRAYSDIGLGVWYQLPSGICMITCILLCRRPGLSPKHKEKAEIWKSMSIFFFTSVTAAGIACTIIKKLIGRSRPKLLDQQGIFDFNIMSFGHDWNSFPSGHTTNIFAAAMAIGILFPRTRPWLFPFAATVGLSRVIINAHYLSDVVAGAFLGVLMVIAAHKWLMKHKWI